MADLLDKLINFYVENKINEESNGDKNLFKRSIRATVLEEIKNQLTTEEIEKQQEAVRKACKVEQARRRIKQIRIYIIEAIFVAFVVGLIVNQVTDIGSIIVSALNWDMEICTVVALVILFVSLALFVRIQVMVQIVDVENDEHR